MAVSGLGFATCCRLIDEFLITRPQSQHLHILFSTRDQRKGDATLKRLNKHLQQTLKDSDAKTPGISLLLEPRIKIEGVLVDLTKLLTVKALAQQLLKRIQTLDAVVWNAGIASWSGLNYPKATWDLMTGMIEASTYPTYMTCDVGLLAGPQLSSASRGFDDEPRLGQVFTANVFGHYMLTHWLRPLMDGATRIVWTSSITATPGAFTSDDIQGLKSDVAYESSKRLTDLLVATSNLPSTRREVTEFLPTLEQSKDRTPMRGSSDTPGMYLAHPGVVATSISGLGWFMAFWQIIALYISRWIGSPWHLIDPYKGAVSAVFAILAPANQLNDIEAREGKAKWGSATDVFGNERVVRTEMEGWGYGGEGGSRNASRLPGTLSSSKRKGYVGTTKESREEFEIAGQKAWREMEALRQEWERRLKDLGVTDAASVES